MLIFTFNSFTLSSVLLHTTSYVMLEEFFPEILIRTAYGNHTVYICI